jgi:hypothetical protein
MKGKTSVVKICKNFWKEIPVFEYRRGNQKKKNRLYNK